MDSLPISVYYGGADFFLFSGIVNQGIDARLTGFTKSNFHREGSRFYFDFAPDEIEILLRRLNEISENNEYADSWETDIVFAVYGVEIY